MQPFDPQSMLSTHSLQSGLSILLYIAHHPDAVDLMAEDKLRLEERLARTKDFGPELFFRVYDAQLEFMIAHRSGDRAGMESGLKAAKECRALAAEGDDEQFREDISEIILDMQTDILRMDGCAITTDRDFVVVEPSQED